MTTNMKPATRNAAANKRKRSSTTMITKTISLPEKLMAAVEQKLEATGEKNFSAHIRRLARADLANTATPAH